MAKIMGGIAAGKQINCKCTLCNNKHSFVGENNIQHDRLYNEMKKKGVAKSTCEDCSSLLSNSDVLGYDEY